MIFPNFYEVTLVVDKPQVVTACIDRKKMCKPNQALEVKRDQAKRDWPKGTGQKGPSQKGPKF